MKKMISALLASFGWKLMSDLCAFNKPLMTTTVGSMERTIAALHREVPGCKIWVGGAVLTPEYAASIGADWYCGDAKQSADLARRFFFEN